MLDIFFNSLNDCELLKNRKKIAVAVSGGIDSLSLILLTNEWSKRYKIKIIGITVDHKLRQSSTEEALYIHNLLINKYNIEHYILTWNSEKPKSNIEAIAREERYKMLFNFCKNNNIDVILLGHHLQDQVENFLIRLFRGSGIKGLSSMKKFLLVDNIYLVRPFLNLKKEDLKEYLVQNNIKWIEDESNDDTTFLRNKIRGFLNTFDDKDLIINRINNTVETIQTANNIIEEKVEKFQGIIYIYDEKYNYYTIKVNEFINLDEELQYRIISKMTIKVSDSYLSPRFQKFKHLIKKIKDFKNFKKNTLNLCVFEKISDSEFVCYKEYNSIKDKTNYLKIGELNKYLNYLMKKDFKTYMEIKNFKGYKKKILYTIPVIKYRKTND